MNVSDESTGADTQDGMVIARTIIHRMRSTKNKVEQTAPNFSLIARGILDKATSSVSSAFNKAKETANKAKAKVEELGEKAKGKDNERSFHAFLCSTFAAHTFCCNPF